MDADDVKGGAHGSSSTPADRAGLADDPLLAVVLNLARYHREHEKFYAESPLHDAVSWCRCGQTSPFDRLTASLLV